MGRYDETPGQRKAQLNREFGADSDKYSNLSLAVSNIWNCNRWDDNLAACIKFGNLNFYTSGKLGTKTYKALEGKAKLLIAILRILQGAKTNTTPQPGNEETIDTAILSSLGVTRSLPPLPRGGSASSLSEWLSKLGIKKDNEKAASDPLTEIVASVDKNIKTYLKAHCHTFPEALDNFVAPYQISGNRAAIDQLSKTVESIQAQITAIKTAVDTNFNILNTKLEDQREQLDATASHCVKRLDALQAGFENVETKFDFLNSRIKSMAMEIEENFAQQIARVSALQQQQQNLPTGQTVIQQHTHIHQQFTPNQTDHLYKDLQGDVGALYAKVYALTLTQRLHLDLTEMLYTANNFCSAMALAVGTGFDQFQRAGKTLNDPSALEKMLTGGIGYICKKIPVVREAYELIEDGANAVNKIWGKANAVAESEFDPLDDIEEVQKISATDRDGSLAQLKAWVKQCKQNKELQGKWIPTGVKALKNCSRQSLSEKMRDEITLKSEAFLKAYKKQISVLLDHDWVLTEVKNRVMGSITAANAKEVGENFITVMLMEYSPLEYEACDSSGCFPKKTFPTLFNTRWIACITELYLYGSLREQSNNKPHEDWGDITKRLGYETGGKSYNLFQSRGKDDKTTLTANARKIPLPTGTGDSKKNRRAIAHAVLVALKRQINASGWGNVFSHDVKTSSQAIEKLLGDRVAAAMKHWLGDDFGTRRDEDLTKPGVIAKYIQHIESNTSF